MLFKLTKNWKPMTGLLCYSALMGQTDPMEQYSAIRLSHYWMAEGREGTWSESLKREFVLSSRSRWLMHTQHRRTDGKRFRQPETSGHKVKKYKQIQTYPADADWLKTPHWKCQSLPLLFCSRGSEKEFWTVAVEKTYKRPRSVSSSCICPTITMCVLNHNPFKGDTSCLEEARGMSQSRLGGLKRRCWFTSSSLPVKNSANCKGGGMYRRPDVCHLGMHTF